MKEYCDMFRSPDLFKKINGESIYQYTMLREGFILKKVKT